MKEAAVCLQGTPKEERSISLVRFTCQWPLAIGFTAQPIGGVPIQSFHDRSPKVGAPRLNNKIISTNGKVLFRTFEFSTMRIGWNIRYQFLSKMSLCH